MKRTMMLVISMAMTAALVGALAGSMAGVAMAQPRQSNGDKAGAAQQAGGKAPSQQAKGQAAAVQQGGGKTSAEQAGGDVAQPPSVLLEKGIYTEQTAGDIDGAIAIYREVIGQASADRPYIAQAYYRLAVCLQKKGQAQEAAAVLQQMSQQYPDQTELVAQAQADMLQADPNVQVRVINKKLADLPDQKDFSTPEAAWATYVRAAAAMDAQGIIDASWVKMSPRQLEASWDQANKRDPNDQPTYNKSQVDSTLVEVIVYRNELAKAISKLEFPPGYGRAPYSVRTFGLINGQWKNLGEDRFESIDSAVAKFRTYKEDMWQHFQQTKGEITGTATQAATASAKPRVISTTPKALADDVDPSLTAITVTFDQPMMDRSWSWTGGGDTYPNVTGQISYDESRTTCTLPVALEPGKVYWLGINSPSHRNFKNPTRVPAQRYVILFATRSADGKPTPIPADMLQRARQVNAVSDATGPAAREEPPYMHAPTALAAAQGFLESVKRQENWVDLNPPPQRFERLVEADKEAIAVTSETVSRDGQTGHVVLTVVKSGTTWKFGEMVGFDDLDQASQHVKDFIAKNPNARDVDLANSPEPGEGPADLREPAGQAPAAKN